MKNKIKLKNENKDKKMKKKIIIGVLSICLISIIAYDIVNHINNNKKLDNANNTIKSLSTDLEKKQLEYDKLQEQVKDINNKLQEMNSNTETVDSISELNKNIKELKENIQKNTNDISELKKTNSSELIGKWKNKNSQTEVIYEFTEDSNVYINSELKGTYTDGITFINAGSTKLIYFYYIENEILYLNMYTTYSSRNILQFEKIS